MRYTIRPAISADLQDLLALIHLKAQFDGCPSAVTATAQKLNNSIFAEQPLAHILLVEADPTNPSADPLTNGLVPIGFLSYYFTYSTFLAQSSLWMDDLFLKSEYRNQAIGTRLMQQLCQIAHRQGCDRIDWTVNIHNSAGIRFYQRMGGRLQSQVSLCRLDRAAILQLKDHDCVAQQTAQHTSQHAP
jgi:ribosomal protein S18 acetylase RimI-like enzyme